MITWINFRLPDGSAHPEEDTLKQSPLALLIEECLHQYENVFGNVRPLDVQLSVDGTLGELILSHDVGADWAPCSVVSVNKEMFHENPLSDNLRSYIIQFFDEYAKIQRDK